MYFFTFVFWRCYINENALAADLVELFQLSKTNTFRNLNLKINIPNHGRKSNKWKVKN